MRGSEEDLRGAVEVAVESVTEEIANLRSLIVELRPAALDEYGAAAAIESLAERTSARQGIPSRRTSTSRSSAATSPRGTPASWRARPTGSCRRR